jgi:hypothetical protein
MTSSELPCARRFVPPFFPLAGIPGFRYYSVSVFHGLPAAKSGIMTGGQKNGMGVPLTNRLFSVRQCRRKTDPRTDA